MLINAVVILIKCFTEVRKLLKWMDCHWIKNTQFIFSFLLLFVEKNCTFRGQQMAVSNQKKLIFNIFLQMSFVPFLSKQMLLTVCQWKIIVMMDDRLFWLKRSCFFRHPKPSFVQKLKKERHNERTKAGCLLKENKLLWWYFDWHHFIYIEKNGIMSITILRKFRLLWDSAFKWQS